MAHFSDYSVELCGLLGVNNINETTAEQDIIIEEFIFEKLYCNPELYNKLKQYYIGHDTLVTYLGAKNYLYSLKEELEIIFNTFIDYCIILNNREDIYCSNKASIVVKSRYFIEYLNEKKISFSNCDNGKIVELIYNLPNSKEKVCLIHYDNFINTAHCYKNKTIVEEIDSIHEQLPVYYIIKQMICNLSLKYINKLKLRDIHIHTLYNNLNKLVDLYSAGIINYSFYSTCGAIISSIRKTELEF